MYIFSPLDDFQVEGIYLYALFTLLVKVKTIQSINIMIVSLAR